MRKMSMVSFRADENERKKLEHLSASTGLALSEVLRTLVRSADIEPVQSYRLVAKNANSQSASVSQAERAMAVVA